MIKAVLYDFDGTLADTDQIIVNSWQHVYETYEGEKHPVDEIYATFGEPLRDSMKKAFPDYDTDDVIETYREYQYKIFDAQIRMHKNAYMMVTMVKAAGIKSAVVTSRLRYTTMKGLKAFGLDDFFDTVVTVEDVTKAKPDPETAYVALERLGVGEDEALMLGDTAYDIKCAHNAGVKAVLATWSLSASGRKKEEDEEPDFVIADPVELIPVIRELSGGTIVHVD
ncbi:MAG: HAD-IA family hydrolase [Anaerovoracaceae bacterium]|nr:HAD-IA family hydrolase [Anaerovoracaceae bacterium]